ncbi:OVARIAN TUMOR DOMAIN-containing deubiquitinating enzyme 7-like [Apium graveolens]|uniref:OVARIAN TUMOR DOMAIN-containing deubiquitinating enzyme 7-like n=1 Tax=Apium graveolens TaxID=4045 RepID=UPI003D7AF04C
MSVKFKTYLLGGNPGATIVKALPQLCRTYHDEEHYNSVRVKEDTCAGAARPVIIKMIPSRNKACPCGSKKKYKSCCRVKGASPMDIFNFQGDFFEDTMGS